MKMEFASSKIMIAAKRPSSSFLIHNSSLSAPPRIADALDGDDDLRVGGIAFDLLAEIGDRHVHGARFHVGARGPDLFEQLGTRDGAGTMAVEPAKDADFARGERDVFLAATRFAVAAVEPAAAA